MNEYKWEIKSYVNKAHSAHCLRKAHSPYKHHMCYRCPNSQPILTSHRRFSGLGRRRSSFRSHPHLLPRPYPCPLSAPWRATSTLLVVAACGHSEERNREVSWRVWTTEWLLCACSDFALPVRALFFCLCALSSRTRARPRCFPARRAQNPARLRAKARAPAPSRAAFRRFHAV
jgi:hypothetical protein